MRTTKSIKEAVYTEGFNDLGRMEFIQTFSDFLMEKEKSTHVCLNGVWGSGKTTTVFGIIKHIEEMDSDKKPLILYLDAWKYEHYEHPLFSLLKVMSEEQGNLIKEISEDLSKRKISMNLSLNTPFGITLSKNGTDTKANNNIIELNESIDQLNKSLIAAVKKYKEENGNTLIIFIDELDRAKPDFALKTIEVFHHLQDELPTHVVYSTDLTQLSYMIQHYYGYQYNTNIFLHKVFDYTIPLEKLSISVIKNYIRQCIVKKGSGIDYDHIIETILIILQKDQLESLRTINKIIDTTLNNLKKGFFIEHINNTRRFFLGESNYYWGYVELLILLESLSLENPIKTKQFLDGKYLNELANTIINLSLLENYWKLSNLLVTAYNCNFSSDEKITVENLNASKIETGLKNIMNPPKQNGYQKESVFNSIEL